ncbi:hypothetical protein WJX72_007909 [[Myrmecia] bisecta]|uniref:Ketoreductase domain-containing protein n=1 Tax=[Myrmecia] bisecta TaxID=41462 RepID=A0AAW1QRU4_9CHLO
MSQVVLVTGCSSGLGRALAYGLHLRVDGTGKKAFRVFATARKLASVQDLVEDGIEAVALDVSDPASVKVAVASVHHKAGRIDMVICNAGVASFGPVVEQDLADVQRVFDTNVLGVLRVVQAVSPHMIAQRSGAIVNIGSVSAYMVTPFAGTYCASKAALADLTTAMRMELRPFNISVTLVEAGAIKSSFAQNASGNLGQFLSPSSAYHTIADFIRQRVFAPQNDPTVMTAEGTAAQILTALQHSSGRYPSTIVAGGSARKFLLLGFLQQ